MIERLHKEVLRMAAWFVETSEQESFVLEALCTAAEQEVLGRLRDNVAPEECFKHLCLASAMLAAASMLLCREGSLPVEQLTAGEVSLRLNSGEVHQMAEGMRQNAACLMAPYWKDDRFAFMGVRG